MGIESVGTSQQWKIFKTIKFVPYFLCALQVKLTDFHDSVPVIQTQQNKTTSEIEHLGLKQNGQHFADYIFKWILQR